MLRLALTAILALAAPATAEELFRAPSMFGPLVVTEDDGVRTLLVGDPPVEQSAIVVGRPGVFVHQYTQLLAHTLAAAPSKPRVLVIGLGGAVIPSYLHANAPDSVVDVVEIDSAIVDAAKRWFALPSGDRVRIHVADARRFLETAAGPWDVIVVDAYAADAVPAHLADAGFFTLARSRLAPRGFVASNVWAPPSPQYEGLVAAHRAAFEAVSIVTYGRSGENRVVVGQTHLAPACPRIVDDARTKPSTRPDGATRGPVECSFERRPRARATPSR